MRLRPRARSLAVPSICLMALAACGDGADDGGSSVPDAPLVEIGSLGAPLGVYVHRPAFSPPRDLVSAANITYEPTQRWAVVEVGLETDDDPEIGAVYVVDLDGGEVRRACDEMLEGNYRIAHGLNEISTVNDTEIGPAYQTVAFRVEGSTLEVLHAGMIERCELVSLDSGAAGTFGGFTELEAVNEDAPAVLDTVSLATLGFSGGHWASPALVYRYDGTMERVDWSGYRIQGWERNADATGFIVATIDDATSETVVFEADTEGTRREVARIDAGTEVTITAEAVQIANGDGSCTLVLPDGETVDAPVCGGVLTEDRTGVISGRTWYALDGSEVVEHANSAHAFPTPFGTVVNVETNSVELKMWTAPVDAPYAQPDPAQQVVVACDSVTGCMDHRTVTENPELFHAYPTGICVLGSLENLVFDCTDATTALRLDVGERGIFWGGGATATLYEMIEGAEPDGVDPFTLRLMLPGMESYWLTDERVRSFAPRVGPHAASYERTLAVGFDGTLYRVDAPY